MQWERPESPLVPVVGVSATARDTRDVFPAILTADEVSPSVMFILVHVLVGQVLVLELFDPQCYTHLHLCIIGH